MLGIGGRFSSGKGMVAMPNLSNLTSAEADAVIAAAGLRRGNATSGTTSLFSLAGKISQQSIPPGTLVDYESIVSYNSLVYIAPAPIPPVITYSACESYSFLPNGTFCSGQQQCSGGGITYFRRRVFSDGQWTGGYDYSCATSISGSSCSFVNGACGYSAPVVCTGTAGSKTSTGSCSGGQQCTTTTKWDACGNTTSSTNCVACCTAGLVSCTSWSGSAGGQSRTCTYRRSNCSTYTVTETRCAASSTTTCGSCVRIGGLVGSYKSCTTTTTTTSCTTSTSSSSVKC